MNRNVLKTVLATSLVLAVNAALASDCNWSQLTEQEKATLASGKNVVRYYMDADGARSHIDQWGFSGNTSLFEATANFYDVSEQDDIAGVADISLADGEVASNNPVIYNVVPKAGNPFGQLYQPFSYEEKVKADGEAYNITVNYLSSPGLIKHVLNDICLVQIAGKVMLQLKSTVTDNPALPITGPQFGWDKRLMLWGKVFSDDLARTSQPGSTTKVENLKTALASID